MLDWVAKMIGLPEEFLSLSGHMGKGGGVIQVIKAFLFPFNNFQF
jgi:hypothetical protein